MATSVGLPDYYAVLQVHPNAEFEVIEAAYRQLMKKHHPDVAGDDPRQAAAHHEHSKAINAAFGVLRDPELRRRYDAERELLAGRRPAAASEAPPRPPRPPVPSTAAAPEVATIELERPEPTVWAPLGWLAAAYYLLPGAYEWEPGRRREIAAVLMMPVLGCGTFALATGRLAPLIGDSLYATAIQAGLLLLAALPIVHLLPRVLVASVPSLALQTGVLDPLLRQAHLPIGVAWCLLGALSMILAARLYVFGVLPTLGLCWLIAHA